MGPCQPELEMPGELEPGDRSRTVGTITTREFGVRGSEYDNRVAVGSDLTRASSWTAEEECSTLCQVRDATFVSPHRRKGLLVMPTGQGPGRR